MYCVGVTRGMIPCPSTHPRCFKHFTRKMRISEFQFLNMCLLNFSFYLRSIHYRTRASPAGAPNIQFWLNKRCHLELSSHLICSPQKALCHGKLQRLSGVDVNPQMAKELTVNRQKRNILPSLSNEQANVSCQMSQISLKKELSELIKWGHVMLFNYRFNISQKNVIHLCAHPLPSLSGAGN